MNTDNVIPRYIKTLINKLDKILPVSVLYYNTTIDNFKKLLSERDVDAVVVVDSLKKHDNLDVSIRKFKKFLKHNKLQYIYNNYLNSAQIKFSLYT
jgi:tryptophan synthase alpha subunit